MGGNFEQSGDPCSFDSTGNFTMAFVGAGMQGSRFSSPEDSQFANTEGEYTENYTFTEKVSQRIDAVCRGILDGIGELMESPDQVIAAAATAIGIEVGVMLEIPLIGQIMAAAGLVGIGVMAYKLKGELEWINNDLERIQILTKYITEVIILAAVAISGVKAAEVIVKQFTYPVMWSKAIDALYENSLINKLNNLEGSLNEILRDLANVFSTALYTEDDIYAELTSMVDDDALVYLHKEYGTPSFSQLRVLRDVADGIKSVKEQTGRKLERDEVEYIQDSLFARVSLEKIIQFVVGGRGSRAYSRECRTHLYEGEIGNSQKGVVGGHNLETFTKVLEDAGFNINDCIISIRPHPNFKGIYEIEYRIPRGNGKEGLLPNQYKKIKTPKTVYDPLVFSDEQIYEWGKEALDNGKIFGREIYGRASNGLRFMGYIDQEKQEITSFFPILD